MALIDMYIDEYLAIVEAFLKSSDRIKASKEARLTVSKDDLIKLLVKNAYDEPETKLKIWRSLRWIIAEPGRLSNRYYDRESGKQARGIMLDMGVYRTLKGLRETQKNV